MFGQKYSLRKMTLEKPLIGSFRLPKVILEEKAPNRELPPKSGSITCMDKAYHNAMRVYTQSGRIHITTKYIVCFFSIFIPCTLSLDNAMRGVDVKMYKA